MVKAGELGGVLEVVLKRLAEFSDAGTPVHVIDPSGSGKTFRMDELLPAAFAMDETPS